MIRPTGSYSFGVDSDGNVGFVSPDGYTEVVPKGLVAPVLDGVVPSFFLRLPDTKVLRQAYLLEMQAHLLPLDRKSTRLNSSH